MAYVQGWRGCVLHKWPTSPDVIDEEEAVCASWPVGTDRELLQSDAKTVPKETFTGVNAKAPGVALFNFSASRQKGS